MKNVPPLVWLLVLGAAGFLFYRKRIGDALDPTSDKNLVYRGAVSTGVEKALDKIGPGSSLDTRDTIVAPLAVINGFAGPVAVCPDGYESKVYGGVHPKAGQAYCLLKK